MSGKCNNTACVPTPRDLFISFAIIGVGVLFLLLTVLVFDRNTDQTDDGAQLSGGNQHETEN
jgi:hypothetical protein